MVNQDMAAETHLDQAADSEEETPADPDSAADIQEDQKDLLL